MQTPEDNGLVLSETEQMAMDSAADGGQVYTYMQCGMATFFGGPFAAGWAFANNYRLMKRQEAARNALVSGVMATILVLFIALAAPPTMPDFLLPMVYTAVAQVIFVKQQHAYVEAHRSLEGPRKSNWLVLGLVVVSAVIFLALALVFAFSVPESWLPSVEPTS